jgi:hypothetical protein
MPSFGIQLLPQLFLQEAEDTGQPAMDRDLTGEVSCDTLYLSEV